MKKYIICVWLVLMAGSIGVHAQVEKLGKVDKRVVKYTTKANPAEVLFDYGSLSMNKDIEYELTRHIRIKINTEEGLSRSTFNIPFNAAEGESIIEIEGMSYTENGNGKVVKRKLNDFDNLEQELAGNFKQITISFPEAQEGSVVELKYKHIVGSPDRIPKWEFADNIPVKWSEYEVNLPVFHEFAVLSKKVDDFFVTAQDESFLPHKVFIEYDEDTPVTSGSTYGSYRHFNGRVSKDALVNVKSTKYKWVLKDIPAVATENELGPLLVLQYNGAYEVGLDAYLQLDPSFRRFFQTAGTGNNRIISDTRAVGFRGDFSAGQSTGQ